MILPTERSTPRQGFALLVTMVGLLVVVSLLASLLDGTRARHARLGLKRQLRQAELLVVAGRDLAYRRLALADDYAGEIWEPAMSAGESARVEIRRAPATGAALEGAADSLRVSVVLSVDGNPAVRRSAEFLTPPALSNNKPED